jgi:protein SCO1/2
MILLTKVELKMKNRTVLLIATGILLASVALAQEGAKGAAHHHNHSAKAATDLKRSEAKYQIPAISLVRQDGKQVSFPAELDDGRAVMLQFMYTSCTTICPITTRMFSQVQQKLGNERDKLHMLSISIDPEYDTAARLDSFARKLDAGAQWQFYSGTLAASVAMQKAFDSFRGDKMSHVPVTYLRAAPGKPWIRLDGLRGPDDIIREYRALTGKA